MAQIDRLKGVLRTGCGIEAEPKAGTAGDHDIALAEHDLFIGKLLAPAHIGQHYFKNAEIREVCREGKRSGVCDGTARVVRSHGDIEGLGHGGHFLYRHDAAAVADVGLGKVGAALYEEFLELRERIYPFAAGDRDGRLAPDLGHRVKRIRWCGFLKEIRIKGLKGICNLYTGRDVKATVPLYEKIDAAAKELPTIGVDRSVIAATVKDLTGGIVNYKNIKDAAVAKRVLAALTKMKEDK